MKIAPNEGSLVHSIALVGRPAIDSNFIAFSDNNPEPKNPIKFSSNDERMELIGAAMIPDLPMYRNTEETGEYMSIFDAETIREIAQVFAERGLFNNMNLDHTDKSAGSYVFQSYIVDSEKGINAPIGIDAPDGSWIVGVKVNDPAVWQDIKDGKRKGFSVEGFFQLFDTSIDLQLAEQLALADEFEEALDEFLNEPKGCLMFMPKVDPLRWNVAVSKLAPGAKETEKEPHVTIVHGFIDSPEVIPALQSILSESLNEWPIEIEMGRISKFIQPDGDVIKIDIWDLNYALKGLNTVLTDVFGIISKWPDYKPHMTLAYTDSNPQTTFSNERVWPYEFGIENINKGNIVYSFNGVQTVIATIK